LSHLARGELHLRQRAPRQRLGWPSYEGRHRIQDLVAQVAAELQYPVPIETPAHFGEWKHEKGAGLSAKFPGQQDLVAQVAAELQYAVPIETPARSRE
jgi:hypothetical protein